MRKKSELLFEEFATDAYGKSEVDYVEVPVSVNIFTVVGICAAAALLILFGRMVYLGGFEGSFYSARAQRNINSEQPIPAQRGVITDRYGEVLAKNTETFSVFADAAHLLKDRAKLSETLSRLSEAMGVTVDELENAFTKANYESHVEVALARNILPEAAIAVRGLNLDGISVVNDLRRQYPDGIYFSHVLGYTGIEGDSSLISGKAGLEKMHNEKLRGIDGIKVSMRDAKGNILDQYTGEVPRSGATITTTIDAGLQRYFYRRLNEAIYSLGVHAAVGLAMDPKTGEVLSLVSLPSYDNNLFVTPGKGKERAALVSDGVRKPLFNRAVSGAYSPGSTIKPFVALAALHEKVITPETKVYSKGYIEVPNPYVKDKPTKFVEFNQQELGLLDVRSALARSSNVFFYSAGGGFGDIKGLGIERLHKYWEIFKFGVKTGIGLEPEASGYLPTQEEKEKRTKQPWRLGDSFNVSIGQGDLRLSPIQLINYISSIANDGIMYTPRLVKDEKTPPQVILDYRDWKMELAEVQAGMRDGVTKTYGRAHALADLPFASAGKTGSAQFANNAKTNAFFTGYAPYEDPRIVVLVLIEDAKQNSLNAIPVAKDVLGWYWENRLDKQDTE